MQPTDSDEPTADGTAKPGIDREPYEQPGIAWEEDLASQLGACGRIVGMGDQCNAFPASN
jgi:hypothetical protein